MGNCLRLKRFQAVARSLDGDTVALARHGELIDTNRRYIEQKVVAHMEELKRVSAENRARPSPHLTAKLRAMVKQYAIMQREMASVVAQEDDNNETAFSVKQFQTAMAGTHIKTSIADTIRKSGVKTEEVDKTLEKIEVARDNMSEITDSIKDSKFDNVDPEFDIDDMMQQVVSGELWDTSPAIGIKHQDQQGHGANPSAFDYDPVVTTDEVVSDDIKSGRPLSVMDRLRRMGPQTSRADSSDGVGHVMSKQRIRSDREELLLDELGA